MQLSTASMTCTRRAVPAQRGSGGTRMRVAAGARAAAPLDSLSSAAAADGRASLRAQSSRVSRGRRGSGSFKRMTTKMMFERFTEKGIKVHTPPVVLFPFPVFKCIERFVYGKEQLLSYHSLVIICV